MKITSHSCAIVQKTDGRIELVSLDEVLEPKEISNRSLDFIGKKLPELGRYNKLPHFRVHGDGDFRNFNHFRKTIQNEIAGADSIYVLHKKMSESDIYFVNPMEGSY